MAGLAYTYIPLESSTLIQRRQPREIRPPGLNDFNNCYVSRSDKSASIRPDLDVATEEIYSPIADIECGTKPLNDYLNSVYGLYGSDSLLWFTTSFVYGGSGATHKNSILTPSSTTASTGPSLTTSDDAGTIIILSTSSEINAMVDIWPGCYFRITSEDELWRISGVSSQTRFYLDGDPGALSAVNFEIIRPHNNQSGAYKANVQTFGSQIIYSYPTLTNNSQTAFVSGPFYSFSSSGSSGSTSVSYEMDSSEIGETYPLGYGPYTSVNSDQSIASTSLNPESTTRYFAIPLKCNKTSEDVFLYTATASEILAETGWTEVEDDQISDGEDFSQAKQVYFDGTLFWVIGKTSLDYSYTGFIHSFTNSATPTFTDKTPGTNYIPYSIAYDSSNQTHCVALEGINVGWIYSDDNGETWTASTGLPTGYTAGKIFYSVLDSELIAIAWKHTYSNPYWFSSIYILHSSDGGATFTSLAGPFNEFGDHAWNSNAFGFFEDGTTWVILTNKRPTGESNSATYYMFSGASTFTKVTDSSGYYSAFSPPIYDGTQYDNVCFSHSGASSKELVIDTVNETVTPGAAVSFKNESGNGSCFSSRFLPLYDDVWEERKWVAFGTPYSTEDPAKLHQGIVSRNITTTDPTNPIVDTFYPISENYRTNVFSILDGYVVLFGTHEFDSESGTWSYNKRRVRWTAPNTINDFSGVGSGTGDLTGNGFFIDARAVNGRIVVFESDSIGALVPRGIVADPWDYDTIHSGLRIISNPVVVRDSCYFVATDGLLYVTNGVSVSEAGSSFDASKFDDFNEDSPIWLSYSPLFDSLIIYYPDGTINKSYFVNLAAGSVSSLGLPTSSNAGANDPLSIISIENSSDQRVLVSYNPITTVDADRIVVLELSAGDFVTGVDSIQASGDDHYWYSSMETGNLFIVEEGVKVALKHVIIHTYTDTDVATYNPDVIVDIKSIEDSDWSGHGDPNLDGVVTVTTSACTINSSSPPSAFSNLLGTANGTAVTYNLPWVAANCRVYTKTGSTYTSCTLVTTTPDAANEYQITGTQQIKVYGTSGHTVYCFCENEPFVKIKTGDYIESTEGMHRITGATSYLALTLDRYLSTGSDTTASHCSAEQMPAGSGKIQVGVNRLVEGVQLRIRIVPRHALGETNQPTVAKITGISLGYIPLGEKILEATGG